MFVMNFYNKFTEYEFFKYLKAITCVSMNFSIHLLKSQNCKEPLFSNSFISLNLID